MANILVIDDEAFIRHIVCEALKRAGHTVTDAENGRIAMEKYKPGLFDLVITDIMMPDQEGIETLRRLRGLSPGQKVVAMSGGGLSGTEELLAVATRLGADATLKKPIDAKVLVQLVARLCTPAA